MRKSKHGGTIFVAPSESTTSTSCSSGASHPNVLRTRVRGLRRGLSCAPPDCAAIEYRWFGNDGPCALAKKLSNSTFCSAHSQ